MLRTHAESEGGWRSKKAKFCYKGGACFTECEGKATKVVERRGGLIQTSWGEKVSGRVARMGGD